LLAMGLFASGQYGAGWNGVGAEDYLGVKGQGVSGLLTATTAQPDFPLQLYAQIVGAMAIAAFAFLCAWVVFRLLAAITPRRGFPHAVAVSTDPAPGASDLGPASSQPFSPSNLGSQ